MRFGCWRSELGVPAGPAPKVKLLCGQEETPSFELGKLGSADVVSQFDQAIPNVVLRCIVQIKLEVDCRMFATYAQSTEPLMCYIDGLKGKPVINGNAETFAKSSDGAFEPVELHIHSSARTHFVFVVLYGFAASSAAIEDIKLQPGRGFGGVFGVLRF